MSGWITIGEPDVPQLTPTQQRIRELLDAGKKPYEIVRIVHMGYDFVRDEIFEIRKWESIMGKKPKFNKSERAELLRLHNEERYSVGKLATKYGCSQTAVKTALNAAKIEAEDEPVQKRTQINPEFDAAVDEMIAESRAANAEKNSAIAEERHSAIDSGIEKDTLDTKSDTTAPEQLSAGLEDVENGIPNTPLVSQQVSLPKLPDIIFDVLDKYAADLNLEIETREQRIEELNEEVKQLTDKRYTIEQWLEDHT